MHMLCVYFLPFLGKIPQLHKQGRLLVILCFNWQMTYQGHAIEISICILRHLQFPSAYNFLNSLLRCVYGEGR